MSDAPGHGSTATSDGEAAVEAPPEDRPATPAEQPVRGLERRSLSLPWIIAAVTTVVAILAIGTAVRFNFATRDLQGEVEQLRAQEQARTEALRAGELAALQLTTFTGAGIDQLVEKTKTLATASFAQELNKQYDQQLRADLREFDVESVGEMLNSFVQRLEGDQAMVFAVLRQTTRYPTFEQTVEDEVRFEISLERVDGAWRVSDAQLLSPTPPLQDRQFPERPSGGG